jgi:hypothetical protein
MKMPTGLKINGFNWKIVESDSVAREGNVYGSCHYMTQTIYLDPSSTEQKRKQCLLHEIMHAVSWQSGLSKRMDNSKLEEEVITALSFGIFQVLEDNKMLTGFEEDILPVNIFASNLQ